MPYLKSYSINPPIEGRGETIEDWICRGTQVVVYKNNLFSMLYKPGLQKYGENFVIFKDDTDFYRFAIILTHVTLLGLPICGSYMRSNRNIAPNHFSGFQIYFWVEVTRGLCLYRKLNLSWEFKCISGEVTRGWAVITLATS